MENTDLIPIKLICKSYKVPVDFINTLQDFQLIELIIEEDDYFIHRKQLKAVEKMVRLHYDLNINIEGIDAINNLLDQIEDLKQEVKALNNRLRLYEDF